MTPPGGYPHGLIEGRLAGLLEPFMRERGLGVYLGSSQGFELPSGDTVAPDHSFVSAQRWRAMAAPEEGEFLRVVPDLVARAGEITVVGRTGEGAASTTRTYRDGDVVRSAVLAGIAVDVASLLSALR